MILFRQLLDELSTRQPLFFELKIKMLLSEWDKIVGPVIARHTKVEKVENGTVYVVCDDSLWMTELSMQKDRLLKILNERSGRELFKDIRFRRGKVDGKVLR
ncbi:MAG: hypothetical protein JG779_161 [Thermotoga sp.]|jgi:predicted nucleic acid-binding Zn ribbon protein|nr:hypothetical protein [Thermotoga sp.]MDK2893372.1 hypothetical protein [Thermotoga sp.]MDK2898052.1 hypothetical protein [Thermotoga sp.]HAA82100.1 DUF721 domain-containing protein [Thermotoga petrophila]